MAMCGLVFLYRQGEDAAGLSEKVNRALNCLSHRGPDDEGLWCKAPSIMGHRRLSIIDLEKSRQPMADPSGQFVLAYNGEVYNFKELRHGLKDYWDFRTHGDTEVVLAGLALHGYSFLKRMEGMWAFALWDQINKTLLLGRDRMGEKPLYYQYDKEGVSCASELAALNNLSYYSWQEDMDSTADYLRYGYYLPGTTAYQDVHEVLPGHVIRWGFRGELEQTPFWKLPIGGFSGSKQQACATLRETLTRSVQRRLVADVEVGAFLSGGVDSSLIVSILSKELGVKVKTFTIGFPEASYDERKYANIIAQLSATDHFERCYDDWDLEELTSLILQNVGQPFADSSLLPTAMVSKLASQRVKVVLSGDGGDELFSGYQRYQARTLLRWYTRLPDLIKKNTERLIRSIPEPMSHHSHSLLKKAHLFLDIVNRQKCETPYVAPVLYTREDYRMLLPELHNKGHKPPMLPEETGEGSIHDMMAADAVVYLPQDILTKVDRAGMAHSLEARTPYLDKNLVELAFSLPLRWHRHGYRGKRILREAFHDMLPDSIWRRRKQGFGVPIHKWFRNGLGIQLMELLEQLDTPLNTSYIRQILEAHRNGQRDHGHRLWNIYIYLLWLHYRPWQIS